MSQDGVSRIYFRYLARANMLIVHQDCTLFNFCLLSCSERNRDSNKPLSSALFINWFHFSPTLKLFPAEAWVSNSSMEVPSGTSTRKGSWIWSRERRFSYSTSNIHCKTRFKSCSSRTYKSVLTHCPHELNRNLCLTFFG